MAYDPKQPRDPAGTPTGGQWILEGGVDAGRAARTAAGIGTAGSMPTLQTQEGLLSLVNQGTTYADDDSREVGISHSVRRKLINGQLIITKEQDRAVGDNRLEQVTYELDQRLGLNIVPESVWDPAWQASHTLAIEDFKSGYTADPQFPEEMAKMQMLDFVSMNSDRHDGNWLVKDGHIVAVDHNLTFGLAVSDDTNSSGEPRAVLGGFSQWGVTEKWENQRAFWNVKRLPLGIQYKRSLEQFVRSGDVDGFASSVLSVSRRKAMRLRAVRLLKDWDDWFDTKEDD